MKILKAKLSGWAMQGYGPAIGPDLPPPDMNQCYLDVFEAIASGGDVGGRIKYIGYFSRSEKPYGQFIARLPGQEDLRPKTGDLCWLLLDGDINDCLFLGAVEEADAPDKILGT